MRRPEDPKTSETSTAANSEGPSAATSEVGVESNGNDSTPHSDVKKSQMTREEREAKYAEARERIFGKQDEADSNETGDENISRASSTTGKKKNKQRNLSNDDFEPRSQFPHYYGPPQYPTNGIQGDQFYYQPYAAPAGQYPVPHGVGQNYSQGYQMMPNADGTFWNPAMSAQAPMPVGPYPPGPPNAGYDMSAHFHAGMSFQNGPTPGGKMQQSAVPPYGPSQVPHWHQNPYDQYQYGRPQYAPDQQVGMMQAPAYPYGQYPYSFPGSVPPKPHQHNGYPRPQFNPQIHPFVPSAANNRTMPMPHSMSPMSPYNHYQPPSHMPNGSRSAPPGNPSNRPGFTSPRTTSASTPVPVTAMLAHDSQTVAGASSASASPPNGTSRVLEITAKWGTPSHLPPKPPPPKSLEPLKFHEINRGLPTYPGLPLPRIGGANGFGGAAAGAAAAGPPTAGAAANAGPGGGSPEKYPVAGTPSKGT